jgi:glucose/arabinose dehydrogenase
MRGETWTLVACAAVLAACETAIANRPAPACAPDNAGLTLPAGFCASIFADSLGRPRHIAVARNGDVFVAMGGRGGGVLALRDANRDGQAEVQARFGPSSGGGIALRGNNLFFAPNDAVLRYTLQPGQLEPSGAPDTIARELPAGSGHTVKTVALGRNNELFVNIGSATNSCQVADRQNESPGHDPCTELETRAGIWLFDAARKNQRQSDGSRFATGLRNMVAITTTADGVLYGVQHGRDQLFQNWGKLFDAKYSAENPAEILVRLDRGDDYGWPYCFYSVETKQQVLAPEYGGDGKQVGRCSARKTPLVAFPGHWAPNAVLFYTGSQFPAKYRGGVFVAFHGSWNRAPQPQGGFNVAFVPFANGRPSGNYEVFADGFAGRPTIASPGDAAHRPGGLALSPDGALYVTDDAGGRIYRISYSPR